MKRRRAGDKSMHAKRSERERDRQRGAMRVQW